jgi:hypothetical protein
MPQLDIRTLPQASGPVHDGVNEMNLKIASSKVGTRVAPVRYLW